MFVTSRAMNLRSLRRCNLSAYPPRLLIPPLCIRHHPFSITRVSPLSTLQTSPLYSSKRKKKSDIPSSWTNDERLLRGAPDTQELEAMQYKTDFTKIVPILWSRDESLWLMEDGEKYYFWSPIDEALACVTEPRDLCGILALLKRREWPRCVGVPCDYEGFNN